MRAHGVFRLLCGLTLAALIAQQGGCAAFTDVKFRRCFEFTQDHVTCHKSMDEAIAIESIPGRVVAWPAVMPAGYLALGADVFTRAGALLTDICLVNPVQIAPLAASDTRELVWEAGPDDYFYQSILLLPKLVVTPVVFTGDWLWINLTGD